MSHLSSGEANHSCERDQNSDRILIPEVASMAGVAESSVSRALHGHPNVTPELRGKVHSAIEALRYEPNLMARGTGSSVSLWAGTNPIVDLYAEARRSGGLT